MSTAREILRQADDLKREQVKMNCLAARVEERLDITDAQIAVGGSMFPVPPSVMRAIADAVLVHQNNLTDRIDALEARVQVVEP